MPCWRDKTEHGSPKFILADSNMTANSAGGGATWGDVWLGKCIFTQALNQGKGGTTPAGTYINPTGPPGFCQGIFHGMAFELGKDGWQGRLNVHEWMDISPVHPQYYQMTMQQRENLEARIKQGLASISQSVSDLELVDHDVRKYDEYMDYLTGLKDDDEITKISIFHKKLKIQIIYYQNFESQISPLFFQSLTNFSALESGKSQ